MVEIKVTRDSTTVKKIFDKDGNLIEESVEEDTE